SLPRPVAAPSRIHLPFTKSTPVLAEDSLDGLLLLRRFATALVDGLLGQRTVELAVLLRLAAALLDRLARERADPLCRVGGGRAAGDQAADRRDDRQYGYDEQDLFLHGFSFSFRHAVRSKDTEQLQPGASQP